MRKYLIAAAFAVSAVAASAPASAQVDPQRYGWGYSNPDWRFSGGYLQQRLDRVRNRIERLDQRDRLSEREARYLRQEVRELRYRLNRQAWNGLGRGERRNLELRIDRLEQRVFREARDANGRRGGYGDRRWDGNYDRDGYWSRDGRWIERN